MNLNAIKNKVTSAVAVLKNENTANALNNVLKNSLYLEAIRNLNWSRGYCWYVEIDGMPNPFQRGGVIGLPTTDISIEIANGQTYSWDTPIEPIIVPRGRDARRIQLSFLDDEQATASTFFERWYNMIYDVSRGVLPLSECVKCISITRTKATRSGISKSYTPYTANYGNDQKFEKANASLNSSRDYLVFPETTFQETLDYSSGAPRKYQVSLIIAKDITGDYGNPTVIEGHATLLGNVLNTTSGSSWLDKIADYI